MTDPKRSSFSLNLKTPEVAAFLESDRLKADVSKTTYLNDLLAVLSNLPVIFSSPGSSILHELVALKQLLAEDIIHQIPQLAATTRRDPVQMLLYLVEKGIAADEQLSRLNLRKHRKAHVSLRVTCHQLSTAIANPKRSSFSLNLKTIEVAAFLESDRLKAGVSKTAYLNDLLAVLSNLPAIFSSSDSSMLDEIAAFKQLLEDDVINQIPQLAAATRRDPIQMLLYLVEKGIGADEQLNNLNLREGTKADINRSLATIHSELVGQSNDQMTIAA
ncbi:MAG: hypothetical protein DCF25_02395 [Leptolyngbya foveolarum]|uniref:Uncharacterized protein n=1 Tax=Leptolyngbya foveolarum TaxID=47253 RepID=A0A2W4UP47_9CYAN|nr:MAG: hypothetical protein DCF25_02395 [Leptolyngbya foveolarum]